MTSRTAAAGGLPAPTGRELHKNSNARDALRALDQHDSIQILTFGQFSIGDLLRALLDRTGPAKVTISTWTAAKAEIEHAYQLIHDQRIITMRWLVDRSFKTRQPEYCAALTQRFGPEAIRTTRTHAKFLIVRGEHETFTVHTSANLNANARLESMQVIRGAEHAKWLDGIVDDLWDELAEGDMSGELPGNVPSDDRPAVRMGDAVRVGR